MTWKKLPWDDDAGSIVVRKNSGADIGTRPRLNFIEGSNVTLAISDDASGGEIDISIAATGGTGGGTGYVLAATDTPALIKNRADGTCSATSAETEINTAFATYDTVILTEGTFIVDGSINIGAGQSLIGSGADTIIKVKDAHNATLEVLWIYNVADTIVTNLTLDGNRTNQNPIYDHYGAVYYTATSFIMSGCWVKNFTKDSIRARTDCKHGIISTCIIDNNDYGPSIESGSTYITVCNCMIRRSQYSGLYISSASHITFSNNFVLESSQITTNTWPDIKIEGGGGSDPVTDNAIQGNVVRAGDLTNKSKYAVEVNNSNCTRILISNNDFYGAGVTSTFLDNGTNTLYGAGNRIKDGSWSGGGSGSTTWTGLTDTAASISALQLVRGNSGGTALEMVTQSTLKLDDFGTPDDNTDLNASITRHGLLPKLGGGTTNFLRADGSWQAPSGGGVTDHGALTGLADDDHTQYLLVNGTRDMSGDLDMSDTNDIVGIHDLHLGSGDSTFIMDSAGSNYIIGMQYGPPSSVTIYGDLGLNNHKITTLLDPTANQDAATKNYHDKNIGGAAATELTIASGVVTITQSFHTIDTEGDASTDDLETISGGTSGQVLIIRAADSSRTVILKDNFFGGNLELAGDMVLDHYTDTLTLIYDSTKWLEVSRSNNGV